MTPDEKIILCWLQNIIDKAESKQITLEGFVMTGDLHRGSLTGGSLTVHWDAAGNIDDDLNDMLEDAGFFDGDDDDDEGVVVEWRL